MKITAYEKRKYVLKDKKDFIILEKIKQIEKLRINNTNKLLKKHQK
ncbi:MAG: hypothetical protein WC533_02085 [Candidatus Pacearchaeota archaeon]